MIESEFPSATSTAPTIPVGQILHGDNRAVLATLPPACVALAYLDPPFGTDRDFGAYSDRLAVDGETLADLQAWPVPAYRLFDLLPAMGIEPAEQAYLARLGVQLLAVRRVVQDSGAIWIHVDERFAHVVRLLGELLLAPARWQRTIIWRYRRWPTRARGHQRMHDVLLWFAGPGFTFHGLVGYEVLAPSTLKTFKGRKQRASFTADGQRRSERTTEAAIGPPLSDVWDVPILPPSGHERARSGRYPTQKPEALLERVIRSTSNEGDIVLDPFCGSGTACATAHKLGRRWIGIDAGEVAVRTARARLGLSG
jgi:DNA modification methylase